MLKSDSIERRINFLTTLPPPHRNMIKSFYTASLLVDVLSVFGELSEEVSAYFKFYSFIVLFLIVTLPLNHTLILFKSVSWSVWPQMSYCRELTCVWVTDNDSLSAQVPQGEADFPSGESSLGTLPSHNEPTECYSYLAFSHCAEHNGGVGLPVKRENVLALDLGCI